MDALCSKWEQQEYRQTDRQIDNVFIEGAQTDVEQFYQKNMLWVKKKEPLLQRYEIILQWKTSNVLKSF
jgi:hypothetical protein